MDFDNAYLVFANIYQIRVTHNCRRFITISNNFRFPFWSYSIWSVKSWRDMLGTCCCSDSERELYMLSANFFAEGILL
jgi:hypothetical protein